MTITKNSVLSFAEIDKKDRVKAAYKALEKGVKELWESDKYKEYLKTLSKFHNYSYSNLVLILLQKPHATRVASFKKWKEFNRSVKKGEKAIYIWYPFKVKDKNAEITDDGEEKMITLFGMGPVFDISQTEGEELPSIVAKLSGDCEYLKTAIDLAPCEVRFVDDLEEINGCYNPAGDYIEINNSLDDMAKFKTLIHEIAHSLYDNDPEQKTPREEKEVRAESIAYTVLYAFGIDSSCYSFGYVTSWSKNKELKALKQMCSDIQKGSHKIITALEKGVKITR